jgi:hyperosmotically inducible protein
MMKRRVGAALAATLFLSCALGARSAEQQPPDNSKVNARERKTGQPTAESQQNNKTDLQITQDIRKAIVADDALSTYAHNVKVITQRGKVTLKGPVRTLEEKKTVASKAAEVAGAANVRNQLTVAPDGEAKKAGS